MDFTTHMKRTLRAAPTLLTRPPWVPGGHFYSPVTSDADIERALAEEPVTDLVDIRERAQLELVDDIGPLWSEFPAGSRWAQGGLNNQYGLADSAVYASMLRTFEPKRVVEVGSGYSSAVALDVRERYGLSTELTFIEPYTERLDRLITADDTPTVTIRRELVQATPASAFEALEANDVLFIDSTHVVKAGSDVDHLIFRVLPRLQRGVIVHVHDCFWPWQYRARWLKEHRDWNELYFLHAFLASNPDWEVVLFSDWLWQTHPEVVSRHLPTTSADRPGALWLRKLA